MGISLLLIIFLLLILFLPYTIALSLRIFLFKYVKSLSVSGYFSFTSLTLLSPSFQLKIGSIRLILLNSKLMLKLQSIHFLLIPSPHPPSPSPPVHLGALKMLFLRFLISLLSRLLTISLKDLNISLPQTEITVQNLVLDSTLVEDTGALDYSLYISKTLVDSPGISLKLSTLQGLLHLPGEISFANSFSNSSLEISVGSVAGNITDFPSISDSAGDKQGFISPKLVSVCIHKAKVNVFSLGIAGYSIKIATNPLNISIALLSSYDLENQAIYIPRLQISEGHEGIQISAKYVGVIVEKVLPLVFKIVSFAKSVAKTENKVKSSEELVIAQKRVVVCLALAEARIEKSNNVCVAVTGFNLDLGSTGELITESITIGEYLHVCNFSCEFGSTLDFSFESLRTNLDEPILKDLVGCIAEMLEHIPPPPPSPAAEAKLVKLNFSNIEAQGNYLDGFKILCTVDKFTANIKPRSFDLYFYNSNIYDLEETKLHIISTTVCKVHKEYKNSIAEIEVLGDEIEIHLPRNYYLGRGVVRFLKGSHKIYKWSKLAIKKVHRSTTYIPETSHLHLTFKNFIFTAADLNLDSLNLKKLHIDPDCDIYSQLRSAPTSPLLTLTCKVADVELQNFDLDSMAKIKIYMQGIDEYILPYDEFFAVILAYDFTCVGKLVKIRIRDYPYDLSCIKQVKFGGRSVLTRNRIAVPIWATFKHHYNMEVECSEVINVVGVSLMKVLMDLVSVLKRLIVVKSSQPGAEKPDLIDFLRYFLHGQMAVTVNTCQTLVLNNASPYVIDGFSLDISRCTIKMMPSHFVMECEEIVFYYKSNRNTLEIPVVTIEARTEVHCANANHWIVYPRPGGIFEEFKSTEINAKVAVSVSPIDEKKCTVNYLAAESAALLNLIYLLTFPPVTLIPVRNHSPGRLFKNFKSVKLTHLKLSMLEVYIIAESGQGACLSVHSLHLSAKCGIRKDLFLVPWEIASAKGTCCEISLTECREDGLTNNLLRCSSIEYNYCLAESHCLSVDGLKLCINFFLIELATELAVSRPEEAKKLFKKKRGKSKWKVKSQKTTSRRVIRGIVTCPEIILVNEESDFRLITAGGTGEFEVREENLLYDIYHKDIKRNAKFSMKSIECYIDHISESAISERSSKIVESKDLDVSLTYFAYPFCYIDYAHNCESEDPTLWYKEKRINKLEITLPEVVTSIESEEFWAIIEIIKGFIGFIPTKAISFSDILMEDEFKTYGGREMVKKFQENSKSSGLARPDMSQLFIFSLQTISLCLKNNSKPIIELCLSGIKGQFSTYTDISCQKAFEFHNITMKHGNTDMISPLLIGSEQYLPSNTMLTVRLLDRWVKGASTLWPVVDHLELLLVPLKINFSKEIYKDLYAFFFNEGGVKNSHKYKRIKLPRLYKYIHLNEIKVCITVTGWIPLNNAKITLKPFIQQNKFKTVQGLFDKIMKHGLKNMISQVPSICIQNMGISKKNFLPTTEPVNRSPSFLNKITRKSIENLTDQDIQQREGIKLMFGKKFKN